MLAAILYRTKHKIRIYTPKVLKFGLKLRVRETVWPVGGTGREFEVGA